MTEWPSESPHLFRCPEGHLGRIDDDQLEGVVSIRCSECDFHGYVDDGEVVEESD